MSATVPEFQQHQFSFTRHIRNPEAHPRPAGVAQRNMQVYNDLLFNNVFNLVSSCFPVAREVLGGDKWKKLVRSFFAEHRCRTPYFRQIPEEFLQFMQEREPGNDEPEFLIYLLHYEWVELALDVSDKAPDTAGIDPEGNLRSGRPALTPVHMLLTYPYAVHRISEQYQPTPAQREETSLLVFRDQQDKVRFIVLSPVSARLVHLIANDETSGHDAVSRVVAELQPPNPETAFKGGYTILENLREEGAILGTTIG